MQADLDMKMVDWKRVNLQVEIFLKSRFHCTSLFEIVLGGIQQLRGQNFAIFWPPRPCVDSFYTLSMDKNKNVLTPSPLILST